MKRRFPAEIETRTTAELRAVDDEGVFEGYIVVWDTIDSYQSQFQRGCFAKTIQERGERIKVYYNHEALVGRSLEIREDQHGVFVRGQLTLAVERARDVLAFLRDGTLTGLSFGFQVIKEAVREGVRVIQEVRLFEYGPVDFPANDSALITGVRAEQIIAESQTRAESFAQTLSDDELRAGGYRRVSALDTTLDDIWWSDSAGNADLLARFDAALAEFHASYLEWVGAFLERFRPEGESRAAPHPNALAHAFGEALEGRSLDTLAATTSLTLDELTALRRGRLIERREKLAELPESVASAHRSLRSAAVESLCSELRAGLSPAEQRRVLALLQPVDADPARESRQSESAVCDAAMTYLREFREHLNGGRNA